MARKERIRLKVDHSPAYPAGTELDVEFYSAGSHCFSPVGWLDLAADRVLWLLTSEYERVDGRPKPVPGSGVRKPGKASGCPLCEAGVPKRRMYAARDVATGVVSMMSLPRSVEDRLMEKENDDERQ